MCTNVESCYRKKCVQCPYGCMLQSMFGFNYVRQIIWKYTSSTCIWYETRCSQPLALCYQTCSKRHERLGIPGRVKHRGSHRWSLHRWPRLFTLLPEELPWRFMWSVWGQGKVVCWLKNGFPPSLEMGEINFEIYSWIFLAVFFFWSLCLYAFLKSPPSFFLPGCRFNGNVDAHVHRRRLNAPKAHAGWSWHDQWSKPWLVVLYRGLHYPVVCI